MTIRSFLMALPFMPCVTLVTAHERNHGAALQNPERMWADAHAVLVTPGTLGGLWRVGIKECRIRLIYFGDTIGQPVCHV